MKKLCILLFVGLVVSVMVLCSSQIIEAKGKKAGNVSELEEIENEKEKELEQETKGLKEKQQNVHKNQNRVRVAVHSLLAMEDLVGGIGPEVSKIANEFNNSVEKTIGAEEKIQNKNRLIKFLLGGDKESAELIVQEVNLNKEKIQQLKNLMKECDCDEEIKGMLKEQIINIEAEQYRLETFAETEKGYGGLFGWFFDWLF